MLEILAGALVAAAALAAVLEPLLRPRVAGPADMPDPPADHLAAAEKLVRLAGARLPDACSRCGHHLDTPAVFCPRCGSALLR